MNRTEILLIVVLTLLVLPSAYALNCSKYYNEQRNLCNNINPLRISEYEKIQLMNPKLYGSTVQNPFIINLSLKFDNNQQSTLDQLFEDNVIILIKITLFILLIYIIYSILTKSFNISRWLTAGS